MLQRRFNLSGKDALCLGIFSRYGSNHAIASLNLAIRSNVIALYCFVACTQQQSSLSTQAQITLTLSQMPSICMCVVNQWSLLLLISLLLTLLNQLAADHILCVYAMYWALVDNWRLFLMWLTAYACMHCSWTIIL